MTSYTFGGVGVGSFVVACVKAKELIGLFCMRSREKEGAKKTKIFVGLSKTTILFDIAQI